MNDERRKSRRYQTPGLKSSISDGSTAFIVMVDDVSKTGVGLSEVPEGFDESVHRCFAVINAPLEDFSLALHPCWVHSTGEGQYKRIGFHIDDPPKEWVAFVEALKQERGADAPGKRHGSGSWG